MPRARAIRNVDSALRATAPAGAPTRSTSSMRLLLALGAALTLAAFSPAPPALRAAHVTLSNESSATIALVYASTCDDGDWGDDLLPTDILEPGSEAVITMQAGCWDLKAITADGQEFEHFGIEFDDGDSLEWTVTD